MTHGPALQTPSRRLTPRQTRYDAIDAAGQLVGVHARKDYLNADGTTYHDKQIWWERHHGRSPKSMPLYGLPAHLAAPASALRIICEGEKAATALQDAAKREGRAGEVVALGTMLGAPAVPSDESLRSVLVSPVALWADNDEVGREQMEGIAARLVAMGAPSPKWINWTDAPAKGDAADYFASGGTIASLLQLVTGAQVTKQPAELPKMPSESKMPKDALSENEGNIAKRGHLRTVQLCDVTPEEVRWLDKGYIPFGKITNIIGDPGLGKSTFTLHLIACHTMGAPMPGGSRNAPANAVLMSAEDGLGDTIVQRLKAAGADLSRVTALICAESTDEDGHLSERPIFIPRDLARIREEIERTKATLLVIDPLTAYLDPDVNSHRDQDVRTALAPLARMADETGCAVVMVRHLNKAAGGNTLYRGGGSIGITGAARAELVVAADPDDENRRVVAVHKHNLHKPVPALAFEILETENEQPYVHLLGTSEHTAAQLLAIPADEETRTETDEAVEWLRTVLENADGQMPAAAVKDKAKREGISDKVLRLARKRICERPTKEGFGGDGQWVWRLAPKMPSSPKMPKDALSATQGNLADGGHLSNGNGPVCGRCRAPKLLHPQGGYILTCDCGRQVSA